MHVREMPFLVTLVTPLNLILSSKLDNRKTSHIWRKISSQLANLKKKGIRVTETTVDPKSGLTRLDNLFGDVGIKLKHVAVNQHVVAVERRIRMIKERSRGIISTLPYRLCKKLLESLICRVTRRINMEPSSVMTDMDRRHGSLIVEERLTIR